MQFLLAYALGMVGKPYGWAAEGPNQFDCSGLVQELLRSVGMDPPGDQTAQTLYNHFEQKGIWNKYCAGSLVFYGKTNATITHVAMMIDSYRVIEAGGGGSHTKTVEDAERDHAFVRVRLLKYRPDLVAVIRPQYVTIGSL
jgi:peptidoglycan DL-endopeptidase CwlO